jgi:GWxTD domain-containing protein
VSVSDLMLLNFIDTAGGKVSLYPNVTGNVGELKKGAYVFFELYRLPDVTAGHCQLYIRDIRDNIVLSDTFTVGFTGTTGAQTWRAMKTDQLPAGDYHLEVRVTPKGAHTDTAVSPLPAFALRDMTIRWRGMPVSIVDLSKAIDQLQYVATRDEIDEMRNAPPDRKKEMFSLFWKKRDPTPNTDRNELMDEYYSRVEYANKHFGHYLEGWKTDMGMVYIIFGVPSNIERHPFEIDSKPYEIWTYYDQNREFVFIDATGFGDYRLQNPIWDLYRTRPR